MGRDDAELMARWRQGEISAFEALVRRWQEPIGRFLFRLTGDQSQAADLCQEVFLRVYQSGRRYRETGTFSTWLYRIALNAARDAARRGRRQPTPLAGNEPMDERLGAEAICQRDELTRLVVRVLDELSQEQREALVLRHYEGMSFEAMARLTGTPASTLKSRYAAAVIQLRQRLQRLGYGPEEIEP
jgi:RNA polymerase sigma-70 factor (ECF subfamily)